jgi:hypothetical protein
MGLIVNKKKRYLNYIGRQYHTDPNIQLLYRDLTTDELIEDTEIKCGRTSIEADSTKALRFSELARTKAPIGWIPIKVFEAEDKVMQERIENAFKILCATKRCILNGPTEYFDLPVDTAVTFYKDQGAIDVSSEFLTKQFDKRSGLTDSGAKKVRNDSKDRDAMEARFKGYYLFTSYHAKYCSYRFTEVDKPNHDPSIELPFPGFKDLAFHPRWTKDGDYSFIEFYHAKVLFDNEEYKKQMRKLGEDIGIEPRFNVKGTMFDCSTIEEGIKVFKTLKAQKFVPMNS